MHDGLAQFLGVRFAALLTRSNRLRRPVILDDGGVIDRDIGRTAFEITHGVATLKHQLTDQLVRLDDNPLGIIDEAALQSVPGLAEPGGLSRRQRCDERRAIDAAGAAQKEGRQRSSNRASGPC